MHYFSYLFGIGHSQMCFLHPRPKQIETFSWFSFSSFCLKWGDYLLLLLHRLCLWCNYIKVFVYLYVQLIFSYEHWLCFLLFILFQNGVRIRFIRLDGWFAHTFHVSLVWLRPFICSCVCWYYWWACYKTLCILNMLYIYVNWVGI